MRRTYAFLFRIQLRAKNEQGFELFSVVTCAIDLQTARDQIEEVYGKKLMGCVYEQRYTLI